MDFSSFNSKSAKKWYKKGISFKKQNKYKKSIKCLKKATECYPLYPSTWYDLGGVYLKMGDNNSALDAMERVKKSILILRR